MLLFFVRHFNDIDHIAPIAWKMVENDCPVTILCMNIRYDFGNDYRIRFLAERGAVVQSLADAFESVQGRGSQWMHACMHRCLQLETRMHAYQKTKPSKTARWAAIFSGVLATLCYKLIRLVYYRQKWAARILAQTGSQAIFFDHIMPDHYVVGTFLDAAQALSIPSVTLPHGVLLYTGDAAKAKSNDRRRREKFSRYDFIVATNQLRKDALVKSGVPAEKIVVLGSARYCHEWMEQNWKVLPKVIPDRADRPDTLKLVFFPSKPQCNLDLERLSHTVAVLAAIEGIEVMFKPHTRTAVQVKSAAERRIIDASDVLTAELCAWADAILIVGSSVITEALMRGKTALYLQYLHTNTTLFEEMQACWVIRDESELKKAVAALKKDKTRIPYQEENVERYLSEVIQGGSGEKDVLGRYRDFIVDTVCRRTGSQGEKTGGRPPSL